MEWKLLHKSTTLDATMDAMFFAAAFNPVFEESALGLLSVHVSPLREDEDVFGLPNRCCLFLKICELMSVP